MALENKRLSSYMDLDSSGVDETTKLVVLTGSVKTNKNLPVKNFVEDSLTSNSTVKPLSAAKGKLLQDTKAQKAYPEFTGEFTHSYNTPTGDENSDAVFSVINIATGERVFYITDYGKLFAKSPEFTGDIHLNGTLLDLTASGLNSYKSDIMIIDTGDFIPVNTQLSGSGYEYQITPGSYGVEFTDQPISWLPDKSFNLRVEYSSHDGSGGDGDQDFIHTLTSNGGYVFTRRVYKENQQVGYTSTGFTTPFSVAPFEPETSTDGQEWLNTSTITKYTKLGKTFIEL